MKLPKFSDYGWWLLPVVVLGIMVFVITCSVTLFKPMLSGRIREAEKQRVINNYTIATAKGEIQVTEFRSGTEFNRILQMPNGATIAEAGWVNSWGEEQIRMIGQTQNK